jgi:hypothetical protein
MKVTDKNTRIRSRIRIRIRLSEVRIRIRIKISRTAKLSLSFVIPQFLSFDSVPFALSPLCPIYRGCELFALDGDYSKRSSIGGRRKRCQCVNKNHDHLMITARHLFVQKRLGEWTPYLVYLRTKKYLKSQQPRR